MLRISRHARGIFQFVIVLALTVGWIFPPVTLAAAQDETPPPEVPVAETTETAGPLEPAVVEIPQSAETAVVEELIEQTVEIPMPAADIEATSVPTEILSAPGTAVPGEIPEEELSGDPAGEVPASAEVARVVENLAENDLLLVDASGEALPMASEQAQAILSNADPYFTSGSITYGWTNAGSSAEPVCNSAVTSGYCTYSPNPITDAIASSQYTGQRLTIENGDYGGDDVTINKTVDINPLANLTVKSISLGENAVVNWSTGTSVQNYLMSMNVFVTAGARLNDAMKMVTPGGTITLASGVFDDETGVDVNKPVTIVGQGASDTVVRPSTKCSSGNYGEPARCPQYFLINADQVAIRDLTLDGRNEEEGWVRVTAGIKTNGHTGLEVSNVTLSNFFSNGISISGDASTYFIHDNLFTHIRAGEAPSDGNGVRIYQDGGDLSQQVIADNTFTDTNRGIWVEDSTLTVHGNNFFSNMIGILINDLDPGDEIVIQHNRLVGNSSRGILNYSSSSGDPVVNAQSNWWGCNTGPGTSGCDSAFTSRENKLITSAYLNLGLGTEQAALFTNETSEVSAFLFSSGDPSRAPIESLSWFDPQPDVHLTGQNFGALIGNLFTGLLPGVQEFTVSYDNAAATGQIEVNQLTCPDGQINAGGSCQWPACDHDGMIQDEESGTCSWPACSVEGMIQDTETGLCGWPACDPPGMVRNVETGQCDWPVCEEDGMIRNPTSGECGWPACEQAEMAQDPETGQCSWPDCQVEGMELNETTGSCAWPVCEHPGMNQDEETGVCSWTPCTFAVMVQDQANGNCSWPACPFENQVRDEETGTCDFSDTCLAGQSRNLLSGRCEYTQTCSPLQIRNLETGECEGIVCDDGLATTENILKEDGTCFYPVKICDDGNPDTLDILNADGSCSFLLIIPVGPPLQLLFPEADPHSFEFGTAPGGSIPVTGGLVELDCTNPAVLVSATGDLIKFSDPLCDFKAGLTPETIGSLPASLPDGLSLASALTVTLEKDGTQFPLLPSPVTYTLTIAAPPELADRTVVILYWDAGLEGGRGGWMELPLSFAGEKEIEPLPVPLGAGDDRQAAVLSDGVVRLNFTGTFVLAYR